MKCRHPVLKRGHGKNKKKCFHPEIQLEKIRTNNRISSWSPTPDSCKQTGKLRLHSREVRRAYSQSLKIKIIASRI